MVNDGKPSSGCQNCRDRKIKCDRAVPMCTPCVRSRSITSCGGYRDPLDVMFLNQSNEVIRKAHYPRKSSKISKPGQKPFKPSTSKVPIPRISPANVRDTVGPADTENAEACHINDSDNYDAVTIPHVIPPSIEDKAVNFFSTHYIAGNQDGTRGHFEYLESYLGKSSHSPDSLVYVSLVSAGMAGLGNAVQSSELLGKARRSYLSAIRMTNDALKSEEAQQDSTLISVMLLAAFETITFRGPVERRSWTNHVEGATMLLRLRGNEQFESALGIRLFQQSYANILFKCAQYNLRVPPEVLALRQTATRFFDRNELGWKVSEIILRFLDFRAAVKDRIISDPKMIVATSLAFDDELLALSTSIPPEFSIVQVDGSSGQVYEGYYHVYAERWTAQHWNNIRVIRIIANEIVQGLVLQGMSSGFRFPGLDNVLMRATNTIMEMLSDICASVPQYLGASSEISRKTPGDSSVKFLPTRSPQDFASPRDQATLTSLPSGAGAHYLLFPLFIAGGSSIAPFRLRCWAVSRLRFIGRSIGMQQALVLADLIEQREDPEGRSAI